MWKTWKRFWKYTAMKLRLTHEEHADPKVQLMQAVEQLKLQHRRAVEQAAKVVANQRIAQQQLERTTEEYEELRATADQALMLADQQRQLGDADQAARFEAHAESLVLQVLEHEHDIKQQGEAVVGATAAAEQAKAKVVENSERLQEKVKESDRILSDIERAKMFEALNAANRQLDDTLDDEVPTFSHVSNKVDRRLQEAIAAGDVAAILASNSTVAPPAGGQPGDEVGAGPGPPRRAPGDARAAGGSAEALGSGAQRRRRRPRDSAAATPAGGLTPRNWAESYSGRQTARRVHHRTELPPHPHDRRLRCARGLVRRRVQRVAVGHEELHAELKRVASLVGIGDLCIEPMSPASRTKAGRRCRSAGSSSGGAAVALHRLVRRHRRGAHRAARRSRGSRRRAARSARRAPRAQRRALEDRPIFTHPKDTVTQLEFMVAIPEIPTRAARVVPVDVVARHPSVAHPQGVALHVGDAHPRRAPAGVRRRDRREGAARVRERAPAEPQHLRRRRARTTSSSSRSRWSRARRSPTTSTPTTTGCSRCRCRSRTSTTRRAT